MERSLRCLWRELPVVDVLSFIGILLVYIWVVIPETGGHSLLKVVFTASALGVAIWSVRYRNGKRWERKAGFRTDNLPRALLIYLGASIPYAGLFLFVNRGALVGREFEWMDFGNVAMLLFWAFLQEFCLLAFLFNRLRQIFGGREAPAVLVAASIFAFFHFPNPFLTLYTLGGGIILAALFTRWPNLLAASLAHAAASALVGGMLPGAVTGWMKIGPLYLWKIV